ncbi:MAG: protein kinase [Candidatus Sungiibacteriota bacterium]|uniref:Protein kinase n=1 Tax=Candidatus Sungiibacteriota bacterium TaxID=2750080 RepID=A0A7T5RJG0_9BACT|nr:MAG: protein kinase [Candidatus Sungbacteria bacterium]
MAHARSIEELYEVLEVSLKASPEVLHAAFRALMAKHHPDPPNRTEADEERAKEVSEAYAVLSDPRARARYEHRFRDLTGKIVGEYRILAKIAEGGFGCTYKAEHMTIGEPVCIKHCHNLDPFDEAILIEEAKAMWDLRHYSVPAVRGLLRMPDGKLALVMSYIPGPTLTQLVEKLSENSRRLDPEHVAWVTERVLNALRYIHYQGIVHGDLKPHNIIVEPDKHLASVVDFGLSKIKPKAKSGSKGYTEFFSAPEVIAGGTILPEADMYSLGMTMIYALSGDPDCLLRKEVPTNTPLPMQKFIKKLIVRDPLSRPKWPSSPNEMDLWDEFLEIRRESFGRSRSSLKPIPGFN